MSHLTLAFHVPAPSAVALLVVVVTSLLILGCRGHAQFRWLRAICATIVSILMLHWCGQATGITSGPPENPTVKPGTGRDGIVMIAAANGNFGTGTLLASGRHVWTASHIFENNGGATTADVNFELTSGVFTKVPATIAYQSKAPPGDGHFDMVLLKLSQPAPVPAAERYEIYRGSGEQGKSGKLVGYGWGGDGTTGAKAAPLPPSIKREASNTVDTSGYNGGFGLQMDFDSGVSGEGCVVLYDSGGPFLIDNKMAGWALHGGGAVGLGKYGQLFDYGRASQFSGLVYDQYVPPVINSVTVNKGLTSPFGSYTVPTGSGEQLRSVPVGGVDSIVVIFSEDVDPSAAVTLVGNAKTYTFTKTWSTPRVLLLSITNLPIEEPIGGITRPCDKLWLTVGSVKKPGATGAALDGDWLNPTSLGSTGTNAYPSGDGTPGATFAFRINVMAADCNRDNVVNSADSAIITANQGISSGATFAQGDCNGDGKVDSSDTAIFTKCNGANYQ